MTELQQQAIETVHKYWDLGNRLYNLSLPYPTISFKLRGTTAGKAETNKLIIRLNAQLLEENGQVFLDRTPAHEVAHVFAFKVYGIQRTRNGRRQVHGSAWKKVMRDFGVDSKRCHSYDTSNTSQGRRKQDRPYLYTCGCREFHFTGIRHRRSMRGSKYTCRVCHGVLTYVGLAPAKAA